MLAPFTNKAKIIMQALWKIKLDWDDVLPQEIINLWLNFANEIQFLEQISIPHHVKLNNLEFIEIHGFSDASNSAYGGAIYIRTVQNNQVNCHLLCAKTRVAPLKKPSVARLELCGALTLIELMRIVKESFADCRLISVVRLWCDNQINLCWINSSPTRWLPFVANRVTKIYAKQGNAIWDYVKTSDNPADLLSRSLTAAPLKDNKLWWNGPDFLLNTNAKFSNEVKFQSSSAQPFEIRQARKIITFSTRIQFSIFAQYSDYLCLIRITAYIHRFLWNCQLVWTIFKRILKNV